MLLGKKDLLIKIHSSEKYTNTASPSERIIDVFLSLV